VDACGQLLEPMSSINSFQVRTGSDYLAKGLFEAMLKDVCRTCDVILTNAINPLKKTRKNGGAGDLPSSSASSSASASSGNDQEEESTADAVKDNELGSAQTFCELKMPNLYFVKWCKGVSALIKETMSLKLDLDPISNAELGGLLNKVSLGNLSRCPCV